MTDLPPAQPPHQPSTQPLPTTNGWRQATSTTGGRWAIGVAAGALACLLLLVVVVAGVVVLRGHDRVNMMGQRTDGYSRDQGGQGPQGRQGDGRGPGAQNGNPQQPGVPGGPGMRDGRSQGMGRFGSLLGGTALHGSVSASVNGTVQALVFQRGEVTAVSPTSVTLKSLDGFTGTYGRSATTRSAMGDPVKGGQAFVVARAADKVALRVISIPAGTNASPSS